MNIQITYSDDEALHPYIQDAIFHVGGIMETQSSQKINIGFSVDFTSPLDQADIFVFILSTNLGKAIQAPNTGSTTLIKYWFERANENNQAGIVLYRISTAGVSKKTKTEIDEFVTQGGMNHLFLTCSSLEDLISRLPNDILKLYKSNTNRRANMPFESYIMEQLAVHDLPTEEKNPYAFLRLEVLIHGAMLQRQKGIVDRDLLYRLVGSTRTENVKLVLMDMKLKGFFTLFDNERFLFNEQALNAISNTLNAPQYYYCVNDKVPFIKHKGELTGWDFLKYSFRLAPDISNLDSLTASEIMTTIIGRGFEEMTGGKFEIPYPTSHRNIGLLSGNDDSWNFLLIGFSNDKAMTLADIKDCVFYAAPVKENLNEDRNLNKLKLLIIGPHIDDENAREILSQDFRNVHFMWNVTLLRLFNQLKTKSYLISLGKTHIMHLFARSLLSGTQFIDYLDEKYNSSK